MLQKARLVEIRWDAQQQTAEPVDRGHVVEVQFNPENLKVTFVNESRGGDQPGGSSRQFVGSGTSKLSVDLLFDTTDTGADVRRRTKEVAFFIQAKAEPGDKSRRVPPGLRFEWGSFVFQGVVDQLSETLDYFSEEGVPLRASLSLGASPIEFVLGSASCADAAGLPSAAPGARPLTAPLAGESLAEIAGRIGRSQDWTKIAAANGIEDALRPRLGARIDVNLGLSTGSAALARLRIGG
jgi:hypothetical protein